MVKQYIEFKDGAYYFSVTFNYRKEDNGYDLGIPRNYPTKKVVALVNSPMTQKWISNGNGVIMFGHGARNLAKGQYVAREHHPVTGKEQMAMGTITKLSINKKNHELIDYEGILVPTDDNKVESVIKMMKHNIGGFSFVWNVPKGIFYAADYVFVQNFASNKIVMDSISKYCRDGNCPVNTTIDSIMEDAVIPPDLYTEAKDLLMEQDELINMNSIFKKMKDLEVTLDGKNEYIENISDEVEKLKAKNKKLSKKLNKKTKREGVLLDAIEEIGSIEEVEDDKVKIKPIGLENIFKAIEIPTFDSLDISKIVASEKPLKTNSKGLYEWKPSLMNR